MSRVAARLARLHFKTLRRDRGAEVAYRRRDASDGVGMTLVPAGAETSELGDVDTQSARSFVWLALADELVRELGRMPEAGDEITRRPEHSDRPTGDAELETETHRVATLDEPRPWRPHGAHGAIVEIQTVLTG